MRTRILAWTLLLAGCGALDRAPGIRRTHDDRWQAAIAAHERDLARQRAEAARASAAAATRPEAIAAAAPRRP